MSFTTPLTLDPQTGLLTSTTDTSELATDPQTAIATSLTQTEEVDDGFDITFDFRFDSDGFFDSPEIRDALEAAADIWESIILDEFPDVSVELPPSIIDSDFLEENEDFNPSFEIDDLVILVSSEDFPNSALATAGPLPLSLFGDEFSDRSSETNFEPFIGVVTFNTNTSFFFDSTPETDDDIPSDEFDFISVALHEIGHILGFSSAEAFTNLVDTTNETFVGSNATQINGGDPVPLESDLVHFSEGLTFGRQETLFNPTLDTGTRLLPTALDLAVLEDIGFEIAEGAGVGGGFAETIVVDTLIDEADGSIVDGDISLRDALANVTDGGTIAFSEEVAGGTILLENGELFIDFPVTIDGGERGITIDADGQSRVLRVNGAFGSDTTVNLSELTITGGNSSSEGGGITNRFGTLTLTNSTLSGNTSESYGGGITNRFGTLTITNSTISGNSSDSYGGGVVNGSGTLTITNSTISRNTADSDGGGIVNESNSSLSIVSSTISDNSASYGGGILNDDGMLSIANSTIASNSANYGGGIYSGSSDAIDLTSTIVAGNVASSYGADLFSDETIAASFSLIQQSDAENLVGEGGNNLFGVDPLLDPNGLQNNGGPIPTIALQPGSPAIDAGNNPDNLTTDLRGSGFPRVIGTAADIGAFEFGVASPDEMETMELDLDGGGINPFVDLLNLFRVAAGAPQAVAIAPGITQQAIIDAASAVLDTFSAELDIDDTGGFDPFVDALNIFRVAAGAPQAVVVTAEAAENGVTQQAIVDAAQGLIS